MQQWTGEAITVEYKPFYLDPTIPPTGVDFRERLRAKAGGRFPVEHFFEAPRQMGERVGLRFNFEAIAKAPNTTLSHCLIALTPADKVDALVEDVYAAYFEYGQDIGDLYTLLEIAAKHEMDTSTLEAQFQCIETRAQVQEEVRAAYELGINAVPFFIINHKYAFSGAQPPEVITQILERVQKEQL